MNLITLLEKNTSNVNELQESQPLFICPSYKHTHFKTGQRNLPKMSSVFGHTTFEK